MDDANGCYHCYPRMATWIVFEIEELCEERITYFGLIYTLKRNTQERAGEGFLSSFKPRDPFNSQETRREEDPDETFSSTSPMCPGGPMGSGVGSG